MRLLPIRPTACAALLLVATAFPAPLLHAAPVVIYRCTDAGGALTVQNDVPCPKGTREEKRVIDPPPTMPAYRSPPAAVAPRPAAAVAAPAQPEPEPADPAIADADRLPPPALFQCNTYDNDSYFSEDAEPAPRCVRVPVTGVDGSAETAAGEACQMVTDQCQRVPDGAACEAWKLRLRQAEAAWKFGRAELAEANQAEYQRIRKAVVESTCGADAPAQNP